MRNLTEEGRDLVRNLAARHGVSEEAVKTLLAALVAGHGSQAQFDHRELGGMGQWSNGGMVMVGDMFNNELKWKVDALCVDLAEGLRQGGVLAPSLGAAIGGSDPTDRDVQPWPPDLGPPASSGSQNGVRYAVFPETRRLAIERDGAVTIYDTVDHRIYGVSQQQSQGQSLAFTSQHGPVRLADLEMVLDPGGTRPATMSSHPGSGEAHARDDVFAQIERLHELRTKDILTEEEFASKKAELLARI
jgi:hypothetical protein